MAHSGPWYLLPVVRSRVRKGRSTPAWRSLRRQLESGRG